MEVTVAATLAIGREQLQTFGNDGRFDALRLLEETLGQNAAWIFANDDAPLAATTFERYRAAIARRAGGEPVAYIVGSVGFFGRIFSVDSSVLVPRPESEQLVTLACEAIREAALPEPRLCDVGTGSGILAITLACELPAARVVAIDVSPDALVVARRNAADLGVAANIDFRLGDAARRFETDVERFDCIVANLPYVRSGDLATLAPELAFEPVLALDGGADGLVSYAALLESVRPRLADRAVLLMEAGADTTEALARLARERFGDDACVHVHRDYAGHARIVDVRF